MSNQMTNAVALSTIPSAIELLGGSLSTLSTTATVSQPGTTLTNVQSGTGRWTIGTSGWNYAKIVPVFNTASVSLTLAVIGWSRSYPSGTSGANIYTWVPQPLCQISVTIGSTAVSGTAFGTIYGASSMALSQGDAKLYNAGNHAPTGFFVVDLLGCELISITGTTVTGTVTFSGWAGRV